jgi:hypothetical protein
VILGSVVASSAVARSLAGPFLVGCGLLVISGFSKVFRPASAVAAVRAVGLPMARWGIVGVGLLELGAGTAGAVFGGRAALGVAACFVLLTVFAVQLRRRAPATPCACLGSSSAVVSRTHVVIDVAAAVVALFAAFAEPPMEQLAGEWVAGAVFAVLVTCCVKLASLALETLPELTAATKEGMT